MPKRRVIRLTGGETVEERATRLAEEAYAHRTGDTPRARRQTALLKYVWRHGYMTAAQDLTEEEVSDGR